MIAKHTIEFDDLIELKKYIEFLEELIDNDTNIRISSLQFSYLEAD